MKREVLKGFYVLEGLDGSGTTTQMQLVGEAYNERGLELFTTCEPTRYPVGVLIRTILKKNIDVHPLTLAHLFVSDRHEHLNNRTDGIRGKLKQGIPVLCDRYIFSSFAYQSLDCRFEKIMQLNQDFPLPETVFFIEVSPEECQKRMAGRDQTELFDNLLLQNRILENYEKGFAHYRETGMQMVRLDGSLAPGLIADRILKHMHKE